MPSHSEDNKHLILQTAKNTIQIEADTLITLMSSLDTNFISATEAIYHCQGRVVVTGIGKSALIGQKIVATLNSTGTPSLFMHAADAIHGDLGMIQKDDIIICISKSGETPEIKVLVPLVKTLGSKLIALVSKEQSYLAKRADHAILIPVRKEADPNNLAPTASTAAQMAVGDAIATSLLALRGFTPGDFAQFHPGGAIGKQLYLRVSDLYPNNQKPTVFESTNLRDTIIEMTTKRLGATVVLNEKNQISGIITDGDLRRMLEKDSQTSQLSAKDIMSRSPSVIDSNALAVDALNRMRKANITQLIVTEKEEYVGIVHLHDLINEGLI